ncbi:uncharacterized protein LOC129774179 [Toxorhynchites rutilus septentrionalis]|uniref:uncharacterized protein LOC129774179 n=1 Tax=Toxorhynchites rutilus septentrionalis TaxID=329112 RepID=UPI00247A4D1B|nr:uncharacterized protein LOC129774179 [Toxorhynchites rutilus septentrionalis]
MILFLMYIETLNARTIAERTDYDFDYEGSNTDSVQSSKSGYSVGSGLRSIAQGSADQANSAVANQITAAKQASYVAQNTLAQAAVQAAATAQTALAGKQVLLQSLEQQTLEAHQLLDSEIRQLQQAKRAAKIAQFAAQQAQNHVHVLTTALNSAQIASEHSQKAAAEAAVELASQTKMVGDAKARVESIEDQLKAARIDYEATQEATQKATYSAQEAQKNAAEAAAHASIPLQTATAQLDGHHLGSKRRYAQEDDINSGEI